MELLDRFDKNSIEKLRKHNLSSLEVSILYYLITNSTLRLTSKQISEAMAIKGIDRTEVINALSMMMARGLVKLIRSTSHRPPKFIYTGHNLKLKPQ